MTKTWTAKDPDEVLNYTYDWAPDLQEGETLVPPESSFNTVTAANTTVDEVDYGPDFVTVVISGGTEGQQAVFTSRVKTTAGRTFEDTIILPLRSTIVPVAHPGGYVDPTPANLLCFYPEFAVASQPQIQSYLDRAARSVDTSWSEGDFAYARIVLAAHLMTINGIGSSAEAVAVSNGSGEFRSMAIGSLRLDRFDKAGASEDATLTSTRYGREYRTLLRRNKGGPRIAGFNGPAVSPVGGDNFGPWTA